MVAGSVLEQVPDAAGEVALEAADGFAAGLAVGLFAREVGGGLGVQGALVTARRCSAQLSWRLPPRSRRWRWFRPRMTGIGASRRCGRAWRRWRSGRRRRSRRQLGGGQDAAAAFGQQLRREAGDEGGELGSRSLMSRVSSRMRRSSSRAIRTRALCSARARRPRRGSCQLGGSGPAGQLGLGPEVVQVPAQVVAQRGALRDEPLAVIDEQPDSSSGPASCATGSVSRPSRSAARAIATASMRRTCRARAPSARARPQLGRDAHDLAAGEQEPLERAGDVPAVLDRPDAFGARPRAQMSRTSKQRRRPGPSARRAPPVAASTAATVCERLCVSAPITIIPPSPSSVLRADRRRTLLSRGESHASIKSRRRSSDGGGRHNIRRSDHGRQKVNESARRRPEDLPAAPDATARPPGTLALRKSSRLDGPPPVVGRFGWARVTTSQSADVRALWSAARLAPSRSL